MLSYKDAAGKIFEITRVLDFPIYSKKPMLGIASGVNTVQFFDETGGQNANGNIDSPGQFSNTQTFALHQMQIDASTVQQLPFDEALLDELSGIIASSYLKLVKNKDTIWECPLIKILRMTTVLLVLTSGGGAESFHNSLSGIYTFNEPIIFRPGEKFVMTLFSENLRSATNINLMMTMLGFLGIEQEVMTPGSAR